MNVPVNVPILSEEAKRNVNEASMGIAEASNRDKVTINCRKRSLETLTSNTEKLPTLRKVIQAVTTLKATENTGHNIRTKISSSTPSIQNSLEDSRRNSREAAADQVQQRKRTISFTSRNICANTFS